MTLATGQNLLTNIQAHPISIFIDVCCALHFAEESEYFFQFILPYPFPFVDYVDMELRIFIVVCSLYANVFSWRKLKGILDQVYQDLLQAHLVTYDLLWQTRLYSLVLLAFE